MRCEEIREWLSDHVDGQLHLDQAKLLTDHLVTCADCRRELEELRQTVALLHGLEPVEPPADLLNRVHARIDRENKRPVWNILSLPQARIAIAACLLILVGVYGLRRMEVRRNPTQVTSDAEGLPGLALEYAGSRVAEKETLSKITARPAAVQIAEPRQKALDGTAGRDAMQDDRSLVVLGAERVSVPALRQAQGSAGIVTDSAPTAPPKSAGLSKPGLQPGSAGLPPPTDGPAEAGTSVLQPEIAGLSKPGLQPEPARLSSVADEPAEAGKPSPPAPPVVARSVAPSESASAVRSEQDGRIWKDQEAKSDTRLARDAVTTLGLSVGTGKREEMPPAMRASSAPAPEPSNQKIATVYAQSTPPPVTAKQAAAEADELNGTASPRHGEESARNRTLATAQTLDVVVTSANPASVLRAIMPTESGEKSDPREKADTTSFKKAKGYEFTRETETSEKIVVQVQVPAATYPQFLAMLRTLGAVSVAGPVPAKLSAASHGDHVAAAMPAPVMPETNTMNVVHLNLTIVRSATRKAP